MHLPIVVMDCWTIGMRLKHSDRHYSLVGFMCLDPKPTVLLATNNKLLFIRLFKLKRFAIVKYERPYSLAGSGN
jgi:hypothetical protein